MLPSENKVFIIIIIIAHLTQKVNVSYWDAQCPACVKHLLKHLLLTHLTKLNETSRVPCMKLYTIAERILFSREL